MMSRNDIQTGGQTRRNIAVPGFWQVVRSAATLCDNALGMCVSLPLGYLDQRNERSIAANARYAEFLEESKNMGVPLEAFLEKRALREELSHMPAWEGPLRAAARRPITAATRRAYFAWQRLSRGWDDSATWSLDIYLARGLSQQLEHLAATTHGWPQSDEYPTFEAWADALQMNAARLRTYAENAFAVPSEGEPGTEAPYGAWLRESQHRYEEAQLAIRWVADNLGSLWD